MQIWGQFPAGILVMTVSAGHGILSSMFKRYSMEQMKADGLDTVVVDFDDESFPENVRVLRPLVWHDATSYCVLLGPDPHNGVFGSGETVAAALEDWNWKVQERMLRPEADDEIAQFIRDSLNASVYKVN
jgi:hypothetical protein